MTGVFEGLPRQHFSVAYADPPWHFKNRSKKGEKKHANNHYPTMKTPDIMAMPVGDLMASNSVLFIWGTWAMKEDCDAVLKAWGFTYKTGFPWTKTTLDGRHLSFGTGYILRNCSEFVHVGTKGKPVRQAKNVRGAIISPRHKHSVKPDRTYQMIEKLYPGPYLELFARRRRAGWTQWGNEIGQQQAEMDAVGEYDLNQYVPLSYG